MAKKQDKPKKPYPDFPLYAHNAGVWAKKIRGKVHYFGKWADPQAALEVYLSKRDYLYNGWTPPPAKVTIGNLLDHFMGEKTTLASTGDISRVTLNEYLAVCVVISKCFGNRRPLDSLSRDDFNGLRLALSKGKTKDELGPVTMKRRLTIARMVFANQKDIYGTALKNPAQRILREARKTDQYYQADEIRSLVEAASPELKGMILLGINCGFGPQDCSTLPMSAIDFDNQWINFPRPKTGVERRCPLWPETVEAVKATMSEPMAFNGRVWNRHVIARLFNKLCKQAEVESKGFYSLRRTFETIATTADVPQAVIDSIMGHIRTDMASIYRQTIFDQQLAKCTDHVRQWYLGEINLR